MTTPEAAVACRECSHDRGEHPYGEPCRSCDCAYFRWPAATQTTPTTAAGRWKAAAKRYRQMYRWATARENRVREAMRLAGVTLMVPDFRDGSERVVIRVPGEAARAALATPDTLDVATLARALDLCGIGLVDGKVAASRWADALAREYARLRSRARLELPQTPADPEVALGDGGSGDAAGRPGERDARAFWPVDHEEGEG